MNRKVAGVLAAAMLMTTAACGNGGDDAGAGGAVRLLLPTGAFERSMQPVLSAFTAQTGITVDAISMPQEDARSRQVLDLNNRSGNIDLILLDDVAWLSEVAPQLEPLNDRLAADNVDTSDFIGPLVDIFKVDGKQYAFPLGVSPRTLIYRTDLFEAAGLKPPTTYEEFLQAARTLNTGGVSGFTGPWGRASSNVSIWLELAFNYGMESALSADGKKAAFNNPAGLAAFRLMGDLYTEGLMPRDAIEFAHDGTLVSMQRGQAAMTILPTTFLRAMNNPADSEHAGKFQLAPMFTAPGVDQARYVVTGWGYGLSQHSKNKDNAWQLLTFLLENFQRPTADADPEQLIRPASTTAFENPQVKEIFPDGQADIVRSALESPETRPGVVQWGEIETVLGESLQQVFLGNATAERALADAERRVNDILAG
ncbi:ABC transporter substrate-binding protein [Micromonospora sp. NPDC049900]|uniref:ABC transporter substrate-binding protein n=1 Tax=unclassified Micromonospora TaxID=2617518 RepID=UPI0037BD5518